MLRSSLTLWFVALMALAGCDEDLGPALQEMRVEDAGQPAVAVKVSNVGAPCSLLHRRCAGPGAQCLEVSFSGALYLGGYCTADCKVDAECGPDAVCPVGEARGVELAHSAMGPSQSSSPLHASPALVTFAEAELPSMLPSESAPSAPPSLRPPASKSSPPFPSSSLQPTESPATASKIRKRFMFTQPPCPCARCAAARVPPARRTI